MTRPQIKVVTFGREDGSWFVLQDRGGFSYQGAPYGFAEAQDSNKYSKKTIENVAWGPNDEWWIRWTDGSSKWSGRLPDEMDSKLREGVKSVVFGPNQEWIIRCE